MAVTAIWKKTLTLIYFFSVDSFYIGVVSKIFGGHVFLWGTFLTYDFVYTFINLLHMTYMYVTGSHCFGTEL